MEEENENTEVKNEPTNLDAHAANDMVTKANEAAERLEAANREKARLLQKEESLRVEQTFGGSTNVSEPKKEEESDKDYAARVLRNDI